MGTTREMADAWSAWSAWSTILRANAAGYAEVALANIVREFPADVHHTMHAPEDVFPRRPRERTPVFYGSFDWHSCVEMHWLLVRLLRRAGDVVPHDRIRAALDAQFTVDGLAAIDAGLELSGQRREK